MLSPRLRCVIPLLGLLALLHPPGSARAQGSAAPAAPAAPAAKSAPAPAALPIEQFTLPNGLEVLLQADRRAPFVAVRVSYRVGRRDDPADQPGMAALAVRLLADPSTRHVGRGQRDDILRAVGAEPWSVEASTHLDYTFVQSIVPKGALALALWLESDRMGFLLDGVNEPRLAEEREALAKEAEERSAGEKVERAVMEALYGAGHPYGPRTAAAAPLPLRELRAWITSRYGPANASLALVGDFEPAEARALVQRFFGPIVGAPRPARASAPLPPVKAQPSQLAYACQEPIVYLAWPTVPYLHPDDMVLDGIARMLRRSIRRRLVEELGVARWTIATQQSRELGSKFEVVAILTQGQRRDAVERLLVEEVARLRGAEPDAAEVRTTRLTLLAEMASEADALKERAYWLALNEQRGKDPGAYGSYLAAYGALTGPALHRVAREQLADERRLTLRCAGGAAGKD